MGMEDYVTKAGLFPSKKKLPYEVTTQGAQDYIIKQLGGVATTAGMNDFNYRDVQVISIDASKAFAPFLLILPSTAEKPRKNAGGNMDPFFDSKGEDRTVILREPIFNYVRCFIYTKNDINAFFSDDWRRRTGVSREMAAKLKEMNIPKKVKGGKSTCICVLIDPMRVFHDMLTMKNDNRMFRTNIPELKKIGRGSYEYNIIRELVTNNSNKGKDSIMDLINSKMRFGK